MIGQITLRLDNIGFIPLVSLVVVTRIARPHSLYGAQVRLYRFFCLAELLSEFFDCRFDLNVKFGCQRLRCRGKRLVQVKQLTLYRFQGFLDGEGSSLVRDRVDGLSDLLHETVSVFGAQWAIQVQDVAVVVEEPTLCIQSNLCLLHLNASNLLLLLLITTWLMLCCSSRRCVWCGKLVATVYYSR